MTAKCQWIFDIIVADTSDKVFDHCDTDITGWPRETKSLSDLSSSPLETLLNDSHWDSIHIIVWTTCETRISLCCLHNFHAPITKGHLFRPLVSQSFPCWGLSISTQISLWGEQLYENRFLIRAVVSLIYIPCLRESDAVIIQLGGLSCLYNCSQNLKYFAVYPPLTPAQGQAHMCGVL